MIRAGAALATIWFMAWLWFVMLVGGAAGGVIVVANRSDARVACRVAGSAAGDTVTRTLEIEPGQSRPLRLDQPARLTYSRGGSPKSYDVAPGGVYYFGADGHGQIELGQIALEPAHAAGGEAAALASTPVASGGILSIPLKILYDQDEVSAPAAWEKRMRARFEAASEIFRRHCFVEFQVVAVDRWHSNATLANIDQSLSEFERSVDPAPARLAIGFSGQHRANFVYEHLGGTRGALHTHMLLREWANQNSEPERLEVLVHELGHFLGATHSPESTSVMRPTLGDRQARMAKFRIGFDPLNTMAMCLVRDELAAHPEVRLVRMSTATREQLLRVYVEIGRTLPDDPAATLLLRQLGAVQRGAAQPQAP